MRSTFPICPFCLLRGLRQYVAAIALTLTPILCEAAWATDTRLSTQKLSWADDSLPANSWLGASTGVSPEGTTVFLGSTPRRAWRTFLYDDATRSWMPYGSSMETGGDSPTWVTTPYSSFSLLGATRHIAGTYRVQFVAPALGDVLISSIDGGHVRAIAKQGNLIAVGQPQYGGPGGGDGRILIYQLDEFLNWDLIDELNGGVDHGLGASLAWADGAVLIAGAPGAEENGMVRIYERAGDNWILTQGIVSTACCQTGANFGLSLAVVGPWLAVGSPHWDRLPALGDAEPDVGTVELYKRNGSVWQWHSSVRPAEASGGDGYGRSLALRSVGVRGAVLLAGAAGDDVGDQVNQGAAYLWRLEGNIWRPVWQLIGADSDEFDQFGVAVGLSEVGAVVGAPLAAANGLNSQGSAYYFRDVVPLFYDGFESGDATGWESPMLQRQ